MLTAKFIDSRNARSLCMIPISRKIDTFLYTYGSAHSVLPHHHRPLSSFAVCRNGQSFAGPASNRSADGADCAFGKRGATASLKSCGGKRCFAWEADSFPYRKREGNASSSRFGAIGYPSCIRSSAIATGSGRRQRRNSCGTKENAAASACADEIPD